VGRSLPLIGKNSASAFPILCKEDVRIRKGEDYSDNNRFKSSHAPFSNSCWLVGKLSAIVGIF